MAMSYGTARFKWQIKNLENDYIDITDLIDYDDSGITDTSVIINGVEYIFRLAYSYTPPSFPTINAIIYANQSQNLPSSALGAICLIPQPNIPTDSKVFIARAVCVYEPLPGDEQTINGSDIFIDFCGFSVSDTPTVIAEENGNTITSTDCSRTISAEFIAEDADFANSIYEYGLFIYKRDGSITYINDSTTDLVLTSIDITRSNNSASVTANLDLCYILNNYEEYGVTSDFWKDASFGLYVFSSRDNTSNSNFQFFRSNNISFIVGYEQIEFDSDLTGDSLVTVPSPLRLNFNYSPKTNSNFVLQYSEDEGVSWQPTPGVNIVSNTNTIIDLSIDGVTGLWNNRIFRVVASNPTYSAISNTFQISVVDDSLYVVHLSSEINFTSLVSTFELRKYN